MKYNPQKIEKKWQKYWETKSLYTAKDFSGKDKKYILIEFPYPSGEGLHMGHLRPYVAGDVYSRYLRMKGCEVMYPIGWDAFGLPAENYAIKNKVHPKISTQKNIDNAKKQLQGWGMSFDWSREVNTTDPDYYKWTQWIFLQFYKAGLAYEATGLINWCPKDKTGLANEEVINGCCERCGTPVEKKELRQWYLKITAYAEKLLEGLKTLDKWPESVKLQQANWIGKSEGATIQFTINNLQLTSDRQSNVNLRPELRSREGQPSSRAQVEGISNVVEVFTTRPDTLFGATFLVISPELAKKWLDTGWQAGLDVVAYINERLNKGEQLRQAEAKDKTGVFSGISAINPANQEEISVWVADYVLGGYGTGAIMAVPAHDERDFEFAQKFKLPIKMVICPNYPEPKCPVLDNAYEGEGYLVDSGKFDGMPSEEAKWKIAEFVGGKKSVQYKLRDWVFSRQRYWGEPIPLVFCKNCAVNSKNQKSNLKIKEEEPNLRTTIRDGEECAIVPVPEEDLPVKLPEIEKYEPTGTGESPLATIEDWVNVKCPKCGGAGKRETNTMPQWAGSSWYYLRYCDPNNKKEFADSEPLKYWLPVDVYFGGMEHTTLHLLYSRFWHLFLYDQKLVPAPEPYFARVQHGIILGPDGEKMSKSRGNVVNPQEVVDRFGADTLRMYELFLGPHEATIAWKTESIVGVSRFLNRMWDFFGKYQVADSEYQGGADIILNRAIKNISEDIENHRFNTCISELMKLLNRIENYELRITSYELFCKLLAPFAPHLAEELWQEVLGNKDSVHVQPWPEYDEKLLKEDELDIVAQVNGKVRDVIRMTRGINHEEAKKLVLASEKIKKYTEGKAIKKILFVPDKLINIVI
ncbi:MAG: hypothetical protein A2750_00480 [Candidatus Yanofskybacteria bacterium RIFCSPHIGHO2_01_FULL_45_42]|uniref:Leucine--tRNA ligase n=3 Tax=Candidatus Yanofskyibacteriota TaxID=1752733 RepID=A0A1F8F7Y8_9BACT|nr:MAG: hypothetical protein A2750_00480 [Candidatus Yanofskybacteria bacterium RIFCSPHIGHO2_01_FULL_45_42]OGN16410.1 MAG: hypothetical protein A3C81_03000 [Candidatus Yanofskybacteria bacterium RIFCSPHIGHO2_02_FULL_46_19]OGN27076.1 MAG: hypothetical protein A3B17_02490 [Candidatus Yanofskybacteria bacterium RIFCSPLOWO2_01_FULL_45_72]OGN32423.1 MAG: hypothetical protein A3J01_00275 [Candidatus Yanofskybacteria bacterium RIFCSPLOWO2_02_FULL_45_18]